MYREEPDLLNHQNTPLHAHLPFQRQTEPLFSHLNKASRQPRRTPFQSSLLVSDDSNVVKRNLPNRNPSSCHLKSRSAHI